MPISAIFVPISLCLACLKAGMRITPHCTLQSRITFAFCGLLYTLLNFGLVFTSSVKNVGFVWGFPWICGSLLSARWVPHFCCFFHLLISSSFFSLLIKDFHWAWSFFLVVCVPQFCLSIIILRVFLMTQFLSQWMYSKVTDSCVLIYHPAMLLKFLIST